MTELAETPSAPMPSLDPRFEIVPIILFAAFAAAPLLAVSPARRDTSCPS